MEGSKILWTVCVMVCLTAAANGKRPGDRDEDNSLDSRPPRNKNGPDRNPELFAGLPDPDSSAQQVSPTISGAGYQGNLGGQNGLLGGQGLYPGLQGQGINPTLGQGQIGLNPYLGGFGTTTNLGGGTFGGIGTSFQNPYAFGGASGQDIYSQQAGLGFGGIYNPQGGFGVGGSGIYSTNPYLTQGQSPYFSQGQSPYLVNPYFQQGGVSTQYLGSGNLNPYLFSQRNPGYVQTPYFGTGFNGGGSIGGFVNPYGLNNFNPYGSFPLTSRFGLGAGRGSLGSRSNSAGSSSSSSSDE